MNKEIIMFISEGEETEKKIANNLKRTFFSFNNKNLVFLSFKADIYQLYSILKADNFSTDIVEILIERDPKVDKIISAFDRGKRSISQIFLFFDYDGQAFPGQNGDEIVSEMIEFFDNETEQGKIYVSYPMVEAIKDLKKQDVCWRRCLVPAKTNIQYKKLVTDCVEFSHLGSLKEEDWYYILKHNLKKANCIVSSSFSLPSYKEYLTNINQLSIFSNQLDKFINEYTKIAVLGGFPFFLLDYFGERIYEKVNGLSDI